MGAVWVLLVTGGFAARSVCGSLVVITHGARSMGYVMFWKTWNWSSGTNHLMGGKFMKPYFLG